MSSAVEREPVIYVIAGVNGAGKSSLIGQLIRKKKLPYYNPDEAARWLQEKRGCSLEEANIGAWKFGKSELERAIRERWAYAFETTLGGKTITGLLKEAANTGIEVHAWYIGLPSAEKHVARVRARVAAGGHPIPERKIRERWESSLRNILSLMPLLKELRVYDNSEERAPHTDRIPRPKLLLHLVSGKIAGPDLSVLEDSPEWAKPIIARAIKLHNERA